MKCIYVCNTRFPTEKAHGLSTVKLCQALANEGHAVDLVIPRLWRKKTSDIFSYYNIQPNFTVRTVPCLDFLNLVHMPFLEWLTFPIQIVSFSCMSALYLLLCYNRQTRQSAVVLSHDYIPLYAASFVCKNIFYDIHHFPGKNFMYRRIMSRAFCFAVQTKWKVTELNKEFGIPPNKIVYWPNGTDVELFQTAVSRLEARVKLGLPTDEPLALYTGQLFAWKGVDTLIRSARFLDPSVSLYVVGGSAYDIAEMRRIVPEVSNPSIYVVEFRPHAEIVLWLRAADVLILPNTGKQKVSAYYTSPMKLFEYMASGTPIVASALPSIMEILNAANSFLIPADNPEALAGGIMKAINDASMAKRVAVQALMDVKKYTWTNRAKKIIEKINEFL